MKDTNNNHINYIEFKAHDLEEIKIFYGTCFGWTFTDYGPGYVAFTNSGLQVGFMKAEKEVVNGALVILYHDDLETIKNRIIDVGGRIIMDIYSFPGGRRFHFADPSGNELAIWSDQ
jgi:predicted enzyme related to lactoylglutathione lyase